MTKTLETAVFTQTSETAPVVISSPTPRPNVLVILMDDVGLDCLQQYHAFQTGFLGYATGAGSWGPVTTGFGTMKTEGVIFANAYAAPVCSPTRAMLLTGRYSSRTGVGTVISQTYVSDDETCREFSDPNHSAEPCAPLFVKPHGYRTMLCGKWHLHLATEAMDPLDTLTEHGTIGWNAPTQVGGFDLYEGQYRNLNKLPYPTTGTPSYGFYNYYWYDSDSATPDDEPTHVYSVNAHATRKQRGAVQNFINNGGAEPWLCYWMLNAAHSPYGDATTTPSGCGAPNLAGVPPDLSKYVYTAGYQTTHPWPSVWSAVENISYELEVLRNKITEEVWDRTVVILMGDNGSDHRIIDDYLNGYDYGGGISGPGHAGYFGAGYEALINDAAEPRFKGTVFSPGVRVPLIITGPDHLVRNKGRTSYALVDVVDIHATIRRLTQSSYGDAVYDSRGIDGVDLFDVLADAADADENHREFSYSEVYYPNGDAPDATSRERVYRKWRADGIYHLIKRTGKTDKLFKVMNTNVSPPTTADIHEQTDLVVSEAAIYQEVLLDYQALNLSMISDQWPTT